MADDNTPPGSAPTSEQVQEMINRTVNGAVATLKKQFGADLTKSLEAQGGTIAKLLDEKLSALKPSDDGGGEPGPGKKGKDQELATLRKQMDDLRTANAESTAASQRERARRREIERVNRLTDALAKGGVSDPFMRELAIAHFDRRKQAPYSGEDDESSLVWNADDGTPVDFDPGISSWFKSEEAKRFLPPRGASGSGSRQPIRGSGDGNSKKDLTYEDVGNAVLGLVSPLGGAQGRLGE